MFLRRIFVSWSTLWLLYQSCWLMHLHILVQNKLICPLLPVFLQKREWFSKLTSVHLTLDYFLRVTLLTPRETSPNHAALVTRSRRRSVNRGATTTAQNTDTDVHVRLEPEQNTPPSKAPRGTVVHLKHTHVMMLCVHALPERNMRH